MHLPAAVLHPTRPAESGQTHVPVYSSKCNPVVHLISMASPSIQLKKTSQIFEFGWAKKPFLRGHFSLVPFGASKYSKIKTINLNSFDCEFIEAKTITYEVLYGHRSQRWMVDRICSSAESFRRKLNRLGRVFLWQLRHRIHSICHIERDLCIGRFCHLDIRNLRYLFERLQKQWKQIKSNNEMALFKQYAFNT